jgi:chromosome segregation ATPase
MKDKRILVLIILVVVLSGVLIFSKLSGEMRKAKGLIQSFMQMNDSLYNELNEREKQLRGERERVRELDEELTLTKESLVELDESIQPIRKRLKALEKLSSEKDIQMHNLGKELKEIASAKSSLEKKVERLKEKESLLEKQPKEKGALLNKKSQQQRINKKELNRIKRDNFILEQGLNKLKKKNSSLIKRIARLNKKVKSRQVDKLKAISSLKKSNQELNEKLSLTENELEKINNDYANLKEKYESIKDDIAQNELELAKRAERILTFQDRLGIAEGRIEQLEEGSFRQREESATLRKQYVGGQLENQTLKEELNQYKLRLINLQSQIIQATEANSMLEKRLQEISDIFEEEISPLSPEAGAKRVDVELIPEASSEGEQ